ncbi:MAG: DUF4153 domain-containing protein [Asticcacaulis sp.]|nr:DUF4153 domain-containing protein [Asticcacaulis sp.]
MKANEALIIRLAVGLIFGLGIAWLIKSFDALEGQHVPVWAQVLTSTLILGAFILWAGAGAMKRISLAIWSVIALGLIALIAWNRAAHGLDDRYNPFFLNLTFLIYPFLFISHELVSSADQAGKPIAAYALYFDEAWKRGVQLALSGLFTALFWAILFLGAGLLGFIGFHWFKDLLMNVYFAWPVTGLAIAASVNLGDVQPKLMHNFRALVLGVLSWLLPVITVIGLLFAVSLCFSGLEPLWKTKAATASLLAGCVALVLLVNAAWQQGDEDRKAHIILRWSARIACGLLLVFSGLAAYSLWLRIAQYGLTPERVMALVGVIIAALYGLGYTVAAVTPKGRWLALLEPVNIALAFIMALICLAVLTPIADPYRLSVNSQVVRLQQGKITPDAFDWEFLARSAGTYGRAALKDLAHHSNPAIRDPAQKVLDYLAPTKPGTAPQPEFPKPRSNLHLLKVIYPAGAALPESFLNTKFEGMFDATNCLKIAAELDSCTAILRDMNGDGKPEVLVIHEPDRLRKENLAEVAVAYESNGLWGTTSGFALGGTELADFKAGRFSIMPVQYYSIRVGNNEEGRVELPSLSLPVAANAKGNAPSAK